MITILTTEGLITCQQVGRVSSVVSNVLAQDGCRSVVTTTERTSTAFDCAVRESDGRTNHLPANGSSVICRFDRAARSRLGKVLLLRQQSIDCAVRESDGRTNDLPASGSSVICRFDRAARSRLRKVLLLRQQQGIDCAVRESDGRTNHLPASGSSVICRFDRAARSRLLLYRGLV